MPYKVTIAKSTYLHRTLDMSQCSGLKCFCDAPVKILLWMTEVSEVMNQIDMWFMAELELD